MKKKLPLIILGIVLIVCGTVITYALYSNSIDFSNTFKTAFYSTSMIEHFESPNNWKPGESVDKDIAVKNTGDVKVHVRISYVEQWVKEGRVLNNTQSGNSVAIINFINTDYWKEKNGYYYYNRVLNKNDTTLAFIDKVKFNENIEGEYECVTNGNVSNCTYKSDYFDAMYTLTMNIDVIQYDMAASVWGVDPTSL